MKPRSICLWWVMTERIVCGIHPVTHVLRRNAAQVTIVYLQDPLGIKRTGRLREVLRASGVAVRKVDRSTLDKITGTAKHQGVAVLMAGTGLLSESDATELVRSVVDPLILVLDSVEDPRNFGACLRTADAAGVDLVVTARSRGPGVTPVVSKVAVGAAETQPIVQVANLARYLAVLRDEGVTVVGTDESAPRSLFEANLSGPLALVLGSEGRGLRRLTRERCDALVSLPMRGTVESLNVSVAAGICLYECLRQRGLALARDEGLG